ncbi:MAG: CsgG/HfaB family protein [Bryobacteraceae bacterium]|nr:CsgG/HfaB family protein [Bryobacteraceae bacterium]
MKQVLLLNTLFLAHLATAQDLPRVAVMPLDFGTVKSKADALLGVNQDLGKGLADQLAVALTKGQKYSVSERTRLDKIMTEQIMSNAARFDSSTAAKLGRIVGVQAVIMGSITRLGREERKYLGYKVTKAILSLSVQVVDTTTATILFAAEGDGESQRKGLSIPTSKDQDMVFGSGFEESVLGEAAQTAVKKAAEALNEQVHKFPKAPPVEKDEVPKATVAPKASVAPLTTEVLVDMLKAGVLDEQIVEIVQTHENFTINPKDPSWVIAAAKSKIPVKVQNAVRQRSGLPALPVAQPVPARPTAPVKKIASPQVKE